MPRKKTADDPKASPEAIEKLAKTDLRAALLHPNCPWELMSEYPEAIEVIEQNPVWPLLLIEHPARTLGFFWYGRSRAAKYRIKALCQQYAETTEGHRRVAAWAVECAEAAAPVWDAVEPKDDRPRKARAEAMHWVRTGHRPGGREAMDAAGHAADKYGAMTLPRHAANASAATAFVVAWQNACAQNARSAAEEAAWALGGDDLSKVALQLEAFLARLREYGEGRVEWLESLPQKKKGR